MFKKLFVALLIAGGLIGATYGAAANINVQGGNVGAGIGDIGGYEVTNTVWTVSFDSSDLTEDKLTGRISRVAFKLEPTTGITSVGVTTNSFISDSGDNDSQANWDCSNTDQNEDGIQGDIECFAREHVDAREALKLGVVAAN